MLKSVLIALSVICVISVITHADAATDTWRAIADPDKLKDTVMTYKICDKGEVWKKISQYRGNCYTITLDFLNTVEDDIGRYLIVQTISEIGNAEDSIIHQNILLINTDTLQIKNINGATDLAESLQRTLFWIGHHEIKLSEGAEIKGMSASLPENIAMNVISADKSETYDSTIYTIGYNLNQESTMQIVPGMAIPIAAEMYSITKTHLEPSLEFKFNLILKNDQNENNDDYDFEYVETKESEISIFHNTVKDQKEQQPNDLEKIKEISKEEVSTETISGFCNIRDKKCYNNNDSNSFEEEPKDLAVEQQKRVNAKETMPTIVNTHYTL